MEYPGRLNGLALEYSDKNGAHPHQNNHDASAVHDVAEGLIGEDAEV